ncbi:hypothetical protein O3W44_01095 [Pantoea sp. LMR881]|uniref:hypothetical protein n=1 Tax=Pantoea sp. LMR881 TaxID=3014336 RepID=UPI0022AF5A66|nr:hypothetical protein [Pantoea sp. LMR881]MCZ4057978.1 hypothetical protein [Pantoea sp. LMR881]
MRALKWCHASLNAYAAKVARSTAPVTEMADQMLASREVFSVSLRKIASLFCFLKKKAENDID